MDLLFDTEILIAYLKEHKIPNFRAKQIQQAIFKESIIDINEISTLSKDMRDQLAQDFVINYLKPVQIIE
ncbi:MAG: hypothetical protein H6765_07510 [Candidatus Peribacteria bacterium]|nr:MAG: hypothetical protein H6765_07510 [Candidatus Peribacteria bacterium]